MSFIAKNPLTIPEVESSPSVPQAGTRGLFAGKDGWYDIDSNGNVAKLLDSLSGGRTSAMEEIKLREADDVLEGIYIVTDACADWSVGTAEEILSSSLLIASKNTYVDGEYYCQLLILSNGELWERNNYRDIWSEWVSVIPTLDGYIEEAPKDGELYARKNGSWIKIEQEGFSMVDTITGERYTLSVTNGKLMLVNMEG